MKENTCSKIDISKRGMELYNKDESTFPELTLSIVGSLIPELLILNKIFTRIRELDTEPQIFEIFYLITIFCTTRHSD